MVGNGEVFEEKAAFALRAVDDLPAAVYMSGDTVGDRMLSGIDYLVNS